MSYFVPVFSKATISANNVQEVYFCPTTKTHSYADINIFKDQNTGNSKLAIYLTDQSNPNNLTDNDILTTFKLENETNNIFFERILVGSNERVYVKVISGETCNIRLNGFEENNNKIQKAGTLSKLTTNDTNINQLFNNTFSNISYINASVFCYNPSTTNNANVEIWVAKTTSPIDDDKIFKFDLGKESNVVLSNIILEPDERVFIKSSITGVVFNLKGLIVKS